MYCSFCGKNIRDEAIYCSECGKNQKTGDISKLTNQHNLLNKINGIIKQKKILIGIFLALVATIVVFTNSSKSKSIVGVWMHDTDQITFTASGDFQWDADYGTYVIDKDNNLRMECGYYSFHSNTWEYKYGPEAKEDSKYWYISSGKLYFRGREYTKQ